MEDHITPSTCPNCNFRLKNGAFFCDSCGTAIIANLLLKSKSTADYDPTGPTNRPWRELPDISQASKRQNGKPFYNEQPWRPALRTLKGSISKKRQVKRSTKGSEVEASVGPLTKIEKKELEKM